MVFHFPLCSITPFFVGGGGYTIRNVSRCWTYETSVALGVEIANELPYNDYFEYFGPDFKLHISPSNMTNLNTSDYLEKVKTRLFENLRMLPHAPGVQVQSIPEDGIKMDIDDDPDGAADGDNEGEKDERAPKSEKDKRIIGDNEYSDSEDEGPSGDNRKNRESHKNPRKKQKIGEVKESTEPVKEEKADEKSSEGEKSTTAVGEASVEKKEENGATTVASTAKKDEPSEPVPTET